MSGLGSYVIAIVLLLVVCLPLVKGKLKAYFQTALLVLCTIAVLIFFGQMLLGNARPAKVQSQVAEEHAESALRMMSTINIGVARFSEVFGAIRDSKGMKHRPVEVSTSGLSSFFEMAEKSLKEAIKSTPKSPALKAKLVVLLSVWGKHRDLDISTCKQLSDSADSNEKQLGDTLRQVFIERSSIRKSDELSARLKTIENGIPRGWYQDQAKLALLKTSSDAKDYSSFARELEDRYYNTFCLFTAAVGIGCLCAFVGVVVIIIQLGSLGRKQAPVLPETEQLGLDLSLRTVYAVFVGWMASQLAIEEGFKLLPHNLLSLGGNPVGIATFSLVSYIITMLPGLVLIQVIALRPRGAGLFTALKLRFSTSTLGPGRLFLAGVLSWCAIIPLVLLSSALASALGSQGSDNPVLPQIALIAGSKNVLAIFLLYLTVAFMAPLCEEMIFRGFLYSALRNRLGIFPAILISALIFAFIHFDKGGALMLCALGPVLAVAFERTRSLVPSVIAHGLWNGGAFAVSLGLYFS